LKGFDEMLLLNWLFRGDFFFCSLGLIRTTPASFVFFFVVVSRIFTAQGAQLDVFIR
jgi:hypothetical protein